MESRSRRDTTKDDGSDRFERFNANGRRRGFQRRPQDLIHVPVSEKKDWNKLIVQLEVAGFIIVTMSRRHSIVRNEILSLGNGSVFIEKFGKDCAWSL